MNYFYNNDNDKKPFDEKIYEETMIIEDMLKDLDIREDEKTFEYKEQILKYQNEEKALHDVNHIGRHLNKLTNITVNGMESIIKTVNCIDEQSQKLIIRSFNR